ncbi:YIEGIA domain-containing protein [Tissierella creatinophila]|uniref:YIEGIA protein n=1 Tax=Tissierella creatinophila DSM 6911 TaxID=1123403 RepID=A0A1U7M3U0_TISCR|nr:YIEGIA domain-containing protein [Tissierella creatinophila]OLS01983.1 hypothetical protein TICRE_21250 [Tissierella creatinophila DSM 6911]
MEEKQILETYVLIFISMGIIVGFLSRLWMLKSDIRQYPTLPNGYLIHVTTGFIAAAVGAVAYPALRSKNYVAVTFLAAAIQQFRDIRKMERDSLVSLESSSYTPRGESYIDGIAKTFEARNYIVIIVSLATTLSAFALKKFIKTNWIIIICSVSIGFLIAYMLKQYTKGESLGDIIHIEEVPLEFKDKYNLYIDDIFIMNVGLSSTRDVLLKNGIGFILKSKNENANETIILNHRGQITALVHECSRLLGLERHIRTRRDFKTGRVGLVIVPIIKDSEKLKEIILNVPILETNRKVNLS